MMADPTKTADDVYGGGHGGAYQFFGSGLNLLVGISRGAPHGVDAIRYGRGELIIEFGQAANYGTFPGIAAQNDNQSYRWGLFQEEGIGYLWKGLMSFGNATNPCDFRDSNRNITIDDTPATYAAFNRIEVNNSSSRVDWTGINIVALNAAGLSIGQFEAIANADINWVGCSFTDMGTFIFQALSTISSTTFRRCGLVTQGGGDFDDNIFAESPAAVALLVSNLDNIDGCSFASDGTGHAMELTSAHAGNSYTLTGCTYTGYGLDDTTDAVIYNNSGGAVTINIDGGDTPTVLNGSGASTTIVAEYTFTVTGLELNTEVTFVTAGTTTVLYNVENASTSDGDGKYQVTYTHGGGETVDILIHHINYKPDISNIYGLSLPSVNASAKVAMFVDENYENPA